VRLGEVRNPALRTVRPVVQHVLLLTVYSREVSSIFLSRSFRTPSEIETSILQGLLKKRLILLSLEMSYLH